jgi:hypothetical protein
MPLTVSVPTVGLPNSSEEPKLAQDMANLNAWANGNIADTDLRSSNNAVRRLILQAAAVIDDSTPPGDLVFTLAAYPLVSGSACYSPPALWIGDAGLSGQPTDFQVPGKNAVARIRAAVLSTVAMPSVALTPNLYQVSGVGGAGTEGVAYTFSTYTSPSGTVSGPAAGVTLTETGEFPLPNSAAAFALGVNLSSTPIPGAAISVTCQLFAYNV